MKKNNGTQINLRHKTKQLHAVPHKKTSFPVRNPKVTEWNTIHGRFEVIVTVTMKITIFRDDTPCSLVPTFRSKVLPLSSGLKIRNVTWHHIPQYCIPSVTHLSVLTPQFSATRYWFGHPNVVSLREVHSCICTCYFLSLRSRCSHQHPVLRHLQCVLDLQFSRRWR
jgi:hypothetical protein